MELPEGFSEVLRAIDTSLWVALALVAIALALMFGAVYMVEKQTKKDR